MSVAIDPCRADQLPELLALLDEHFIFSKGRQLSVRERFPDLFAEANLGNVYVAMTAGRLGAATSTRRFRWVTPDRILQGAMIGLVYTRPEQRGLGLASQVLRRVQADWARDGIDFGV